MDLSIPIRLLFSRWPVGVVEGLGETWVSEAGPLLTSRIPESTAPRAYREGAACGARRAGAARTARIPNPAPSGERSRESRALALITCCSNPSAGGRPGDAFQAV